MKTIMHFIIKEFLQFRRDPRMFAIVLVAPVLQMIFLGYAATLDVNTIETVIFDQDRSSGSRSYIENFERSGYFSILKYAAGYSEVTQMIDGGRAVLAIVIPKDFSKDLASGKPAQVQAILDGSDGNKASIAFGYMQSVTAEYSQKIILERLSSMGRISKAPGAIAPEIRVWYNPELKTRNFMVPSITALILMLITTLLTSLAVVKEKEIGTMEQLIVTPIKPYQMVIGKIIPFMILGFATVLLVCSVMIFWFGIPVRGSLLFLLFCAFLLILSTLGLGLFVSTISRTQQQAMMVTTFAVIMPMIYLSGFAFPIENMPKLVQYITYAIPLRYFITILRAIILKGIGFESLWKETLILFGMGVSILFASALRFRKRLE
ncbi:MAG: ABC transporter permease [Bacteroidota bacterium]